MPTEIEQITDGSVSAQEPLRLFYRFESSHTPLPYPGSFVRLLSPIVGVLISDMNRLWYYFPMSYRIASQLVRADIPILAAIVLR